MVCALNSYYEKLLATGEVRCIDNEIPFEIPNGWEWARISSVFQLNPKIVATDDTMAAFIPMESIEAGYTSKFCYHEKKWGEIKSGFTQFADGDIAFAKITPCFQNRKSVVFIGLPNGIGAGTTELRVLRPYSETINRMFTLYFLESPYFVDEAIFKGTANQQRIVVGYLENKLFPIPPLAEQERISNNITRLMPIMDRHDGVQIKLDRLNNELNITLRKSILQEAIQGKLVPQIKEDGTAEELLNQIRQEKQKLVKSGKLKKSALTGTTIYKGDDNKYYEQVKGQTIQVECDYDFPESWSVVRLSSICTLLDGEKKDGKYVCLDAKFLRGKTSGDYLPSGKFVQKGENIILVDGENSGEVFTVPCDGYMGSTFKQLCVNTAMHLPYVLNFILFYKELLRQSKRGAAIPHLNKEVFYNLLIGVPPLQEQKRICQRIEQLLKTLK